jgi:hypothetical protein
VPEPDGQEDNGAPPLEGKLISPSLRLG